MNPGFLEWKLYAFVHESLVLLVNVYDESRDKHLGELLLSSVCERLKWLNMEVEEPRTVLLVIWQRLASHQSTRGILATHSILNDTCCSSAELQSHR